MVEQKKERRTLRYTDQELSLLKNTFLDNDGLVSALRKMFLQLPMTPVDTAFITSTFTSKEMIGVIRKTFLPELDPEAPVMQLVDLWMTLDLREKTPETAFPFIYARKLVIDYLDQQLNLLAGTETETIKMIDMVIDRLDQVVRSEEFIVFANLIARNTIITHVDMQLNQLVVLAGAHAETVEETKERLRKDSTK